MTIIERLTEALRAAGLPGDCAVLRPDRVAEAGWVVVTAPGGQRVRVDGISSEQTPTAQGVVNAFDFRNRRPRSQASLIADILALSNSDRNRLLAAVASAWLQENPNAARKLGLNFDGDEPE